MQSIFNNNKMLNIVLIGVLLIYYWYFYYFSNASSIKPVVPAAPAAPEKSDVILFKRNYKEFVIEENGVQIWEHEFPDNTYYMTITQKIVDSDPCFFEYSSNSIVKRPATGFDLFKYVKNNPEYENIVVSFKENNYQPVQKGNVFYFTCQDRHIVNLEMCPSGSLFQNEKCVEVTHCTNKPDGTLLPIHNNISTYIECKNGREFTKFCNPDQVFYHDRCMSKDDVSVQCHIHANLPPIQLDDQTLFECQNHKAVFTFCDPGTRLFENSTVCEPDDCYQKPDGTKIKMRKQHRGPFHYVPGYKTCFGGKISQIVECPNTWNDDLSEEDNLTILPMVFDGTRCAVPKFCENVHSDDPDVIVPVHEFTKHLKNWSISMDYDSSIGTVCENGTRKRKQLEPGYLINKKFKNEWACGPNNSVVLPIPGDPKSYFDCILKQVITCPPHQYFDGLNCENEPKRASFRFHGIPIFQFDGLDASDWIAPWNNISKRSNPPLEPCRSSEYKYLKVYDMCAHEDCEHMAFLSFVPDLEILLPQKKQAKCRFDEATRYLMKEAISITNYTFWDQKILPGDHPPPHKNDCTFGQKLRTGNFIWDSTVFATCDTTQPFVFCPSTHSTTLLNEGGGHYACAPPPDNLLPHRDAIGNWKGYAENEVKRIVPINWDGLNPYTFKLLRNGPEINLPVTGYEIPEKTRVNLFVDRPVDLELRYRVTFPPQSAFKYDEQTNDRQTLFTSDRSKAYNVRNKDFISYPHLFETYRPIPGVRMLDRAYRIP